MASSIRFKDVPTFGLVKVLFVSVCVVVRSVIAEVFDRSVDAIVISALPLNDCPAIVLAVVKVAALPETLPVTSPVNGPANASDVTVPSKNASLNSTELVPKSISSVSYTHLTLPTKA